MANTKYSKYLYQVFECVDPTDCWSFDPSKVLYAADDLGQAHSFAYEEWLKDKSKAYTIIQPYYDDCRGGYGAWTAIEDEEDD